MTSKDLHQLFFERAAAPASDPVRARWRAAAADERRAYSQWVTHGGTAAWIAWLAAADRVDAAVAELQAASRASARAA